MTPTQRKISAAAHRLAAELLSLSDRDRDALCRCHDYISGPGFPISFDIVTDDEDEIETIEADPGHYDENEWHKTDLDFEELIAQAPGALHEQMEAHIAEAYGNHLRVLEAKREAEALRREIGYGRY